MKLRVVSLRGYGTIQWQRMRNGSSIGLYEKWLVIARDFSSETALWDASSGASWTFRELRLEAECDCASAEPFLFPRGNSPEFILTLLRAWRAGAIACPLEREQAIPSFTSLPSEAAHLKLTSATTGEPKCVAFTAAQLAADPANIVATMGLRPDWPNLACISLAHSYGFSNLVLPLLLHGIPLILLPAPLPAVIMDQAGRFPQVTLPAVPALWKSWHSGQAIPPNARLAISAGAPLPLELERSIHSRNGLKIHNFYGSTECGGIAYDRSNLPRLNGSIAGTAMKNVRLSISSTETLVVESDAVGETYWPEADGSLRAGRFATTDLARLDRGEVHLLGRVSDRLNIAGRKISPETIENTLRSHPAIRECVVFSVPAESSERGEIVIGAVNTAEPIPPAELAAFLSERLPAWQIPRRWWFTDDLAINQRGKISRAEWRGRYLEKHPARRMWENRGSEGL